MAAQEGHFPGGSTGPGKTLPQLLMATVWVCEAAGLRAGRRLFYRLLLVFEEGEALRLFSASGALLGVVSAFAVSHSALTLLHSPPVPSGFKIQNHAVVTLEAPPRTLREAGDIQSEIRNSTSPDAEVIDCVSFRPETVGYRERAEIALGAKALIDCSCRLSSAAEAARSGLRFVSVAFFTFGFELRVLLLGQDSFGLLHVLSFGRFGATGFLMLGHNRVHLRLLIRRKIEVGQ